MSSLAGIGKISAKFQYDQSKTEFQDQDQLNPRRVATQEIPVTKSVNLHPKVRLFQKTQFPSISTKATKKKSSFVLNSAIQKLIEQEIKKGNLFISSKQSKYPLKSNKKIPLKKLNTQQSKKLKLIQTERKKNQIIQTLHQLQQQELQLKKQYVSQRYEKQMNPRKSIKKEKSLFTQQERRAVKKMFFRHKQLENQLKQKTEQKVEQYRKAYETQRKKYESELQKHRSLSKSRIQEKRQLTELRKSEQIKEKQKTQKALEQVNCRRYLYQQMLRKDQQLTMQEMEQFSKKLQQIKNKMKVTIVQQLKQHKKKYSELLKPKSSQFNGSKFSLNLNHSNLKKLQQNYFTKLTKSERKAQKEQEQMQKNKPFELKQRVKQFSERCSNEIRPKLKITEESRFIPFERNNSLHSLDYFQQYQKGKEYLSIAKKLKKFQTTDQQICNSKKYQEIPNPQTKISYKNYLKDIRRTTEQSTQSARKKFASFLQKQGSISEYNSLQKAVSVAESIDAKNKKTKNQKLIDAVQNKINLLKLIV